MVTAAKNNDYSGLETIRFTLDFHTINEILKHIEFSNLIGDMSDPFISYLSAIYFILF